MKDGLCDGTKAGNDLSEGTLLNEIAFTQFSSWIRRHTPTVHSLGQVPFEVVAESLPEESF